MDPKEFEELLTDVETRLDRLRALYENWFRGYEKLEPQIARKDVERRIYQMRKELPRNTGLRFRYNTLFQRYTTLTSYWHRTGKQIEEGTYRLQLQRLRRKHERQKELGRASPEGRERRDSELPPAQSYELNLDEQLNVNDLLDDLELEAVARAVDEPGPHSEPPPPPVEKAAPRAMATFAKPGAGINGSAPKPVPRVMSESSRYSEPPPSQVEAPKPAAPKAPAAPAPMAASATQKGAPMPQPPARMTLGDGALPPKPPPVPPGATMPRMTMGDGALPPRPPVPPPGSPITASGVRAAPAVPAPTGARPAPRPPAAAPVPAPGPGGRGLPEQRMKSLYDEYTRARRNNNEGEVRYDALVKSIEKMLPELEKRHAGKQIDFEIVLKDGRVGLKPKAK